jgi:hypothetical protein
MQKLITEHPEIIPIDQINEELELVIIAREFQLESGLIDAIGIDEDANLYIIETKLYKNYDKRAIIAQALDYGANLNQFNGTLDELIGSLNKHTQNIHKKNLRNLVVDRFNLTDEKASEFIQNLQENIKNGVFKIVLVLDILDDKLKKIIQFINENSNFDIYAVEISHFKYEDITILIPIIFGGGVIKSSGLRVTKTYQYNPSSEPNFLKDINKNVTDSEKFSLFKDLISNIKDIIKKSEGSLIFSTHTLEIGPVEGLYLYDQLNSVNIGLNSLGKLNFYVRKSGEKVTKQVEITRQIIAELSNLNIINRVNPNKYPKSITIKLIHKNEEEFKLILSTFKTVIQSYK